MPNSPSAREVAAVQSAGTGNGSGRSCMSGRVAPGRGAGIEDPWWYQARCLSAAQASTTRSATSSRRPSSGRIASIQRRTWPTVTGSCGGIPSRAAARSNSAPHGKRSSPNTKFVSAAVPTRSGLATRRTAAMSPSSGTHLSWAATARSTCVYTAPRSRTVTSTSPGSNRGCPG